MRGPGPPRLVHSALILTHPAVTVAQMSTDEHWPAWDPLQAGLIRSLSPGVPTPPVPGRTRRLLMRTGMWGLRARASWIDSAFKLVTAASALAALLVVVTQWPIWGGSPPFADGATVVAGAGTATAFSAAILSVVALPFATAAATAAGYSAELLRRPMPWLTGLLSAAMTGGLFAFSAASPTRAGAIAASLLAGGTFCQVWVACRALLTSADPQDLARRQAIYYRLASRDALRTVRGQTRRYLPRRLRHPEYVRVLSENHEQQMGAGFLRQIREGLRSNVERDRAAESFVFIDTLIDTFLDQASFWDGRVGLPDSGPVFVLLDAVDELVTPDLHGRRDEIARYAVQQVSRLLAQPHRAFDYAGVRSAVLSHLVRWIDTTWKNDSSTVPATAATELSSAITTFASYGAHEDAQRALDRLKELMVKSCVAQRTHIATTAFDGFIRALATFCTLPDERVRRHHLKRWSRVAFDLVPIMHAERNQFFQRPSEVMLPGIVIGARPGLQEALWFVVDRTGDVVSAATAQSKWVRSYLALAAQDPGGNPVVDSAELQHALAVVCCALGTIAAVGSEAESESSAAAVTTLLDGALDWTKALKTERVRELVLYDETAELLWTAILMAGYCLHDRELCRSVASHLLEQLDLTAYDDTLDEYVLAVIHGLMIVSDVPVEEALPAVSRLRSTDPWDSGALWDHIEGLGVAPSVNRNRTMTPPAVITAINAWAVETYPRLVEDQVAKPPTDRGGDGSE